MNLLGTHIPLNNILSMARVTVQRGDIRYMIALFSLSVIKDTPIIEYDQSNIYYYCKVILS